MANISAKDADKMLLTEARKALEKFADENLSKTKIIKPSKAD